MDYFAFFFFLYLIIRNLRAEAEELNRDLFAETPSWVAAPEGGPAQSVYQEDFARIAAMEMDFSSRSRRSRSAVPSSLPGFRRAEPMPGEKTPTRASRSLQFLCDIIQRSNRGNGWTGKGVAEERASQTMRMSSNNHLKGNTANSSQNVTSRPIDLLSRIEHRACAVGIIGLATLGCPSRSKLARAGRPRCRIRRQRADCGGINAGTSHILDVPSEDIATYVQAGRLTATTNPTRTQRL